VIKDIYWGTGFECNSWVVCYQRCSTSCGTEHLPLNHFIYWVRIQRLGIFSGVNVQGPNSFARDGNTAKLLIYIVSPIRAGYTTLTLLLRAMVASLFLTSHKDNLGVIIMYSYNFLSL